MKNEEWAPMPYYYGYAISSESRVFAFPGCFPYRIGHCLSRYGEILTKRRNKLWNGSSWIEVDSECMSDKVFNPRGSRWWVCHEWFREIFLCQMHGYRHAIWDRLYEEHKLSGREDAEFYEDMSEEFYQKHIAGSPGWGWADDYYIDMGDSFHECAGLRLWSKLYGPPQLPLLEHLVMEDIAKEDRKRLPKLGQELF